MPHTPERNDRRLGNRAWNQPHPEVTQDAIGVEYCRPVDLSKGMTQRGQMRGGADTQKRRRWEPLLDLWSEPCIRSIDQQSTDSH